MVMKTVDTARSDDGLSVLLDFSGQEIWALEIFFFFFFFGVLAKLVVRQLVVMHACMHVLVSLNPS